MWGRTSVEQFSLPVYSINKSLLALWKCEKWLAWKISSKVTSVVKKITRLRKKSRQNIENNRLRDIADSKPENMNNVSEVSKGIESHN